MRRLLPIALVVLLAGAVSGQDVSDPSKTNVLLGDFATPQMAPGESGSLSFHLFNPYEWSMNGTTLAVEMYAFDSSEGPRALEGLDNPPVFLESGDTSDLLSLGRLSSGSTRKIELTIETTRDTPSGSLFTQGSYFVRFQLEFDYLQDQHAVMVSPGFFSKEELALALRDPTPEERERYRYVGSANYTYLGERLGLESIDGLILDTGFGVKKRLPQWPFYLLPAGAVAAFLLSLYHYRRETG